MRQRRMAAAKRDRHVAGACASTGDAANCDPGLYYGGSVRRDGRWDLLQRRLVASRDDSSWWKHRSGTGPTAKPTASTAATHLHPGVHHAGSVRRHGRWDLLQRRLVASRHDSSWWKHGAGTGPTAKPTGSTATHLDAGVHYA